MPGCFLAGYQTVKVIREGKEALGTTVEIEDDLDEGEVSGEGAEVMAASKW